MHAASMIVAMMIGLVGFALLMYGKRNARFPHLAAGVVLIAFPWFVSNLVLQLVIAAAVGGLVVAAGRVGL